jgi:hypothetical protein
VNISLVAGVNGWVFVNDAIGEELDSSAAAELGLSLPSFPDYAAYLGFASSPMTGLGGAGGAGDAPNNGPTPAQLHKQQQTQMNKRCAAAAASSGALAVNAGMNEGAALLTGEVTPFAAIFHGIAVVEGIGSGGMAIYAAYVCYDAAQF